MPEDSHEIGNDEVLWRIIPPEYLRPNDAVSEGTFRTQELSVFRSAYIALSEALSRFPPGSRARRFTAGFAREIGCIVVLDPEDNSHAMIYRQDAPTQRLTGSQANKLIKKSTFEPESGSLANVEEEPRLPDDRVDR
jgi:hypothetical protein